MIKFPSPNGFGGIGDVGNVTSDNGALAVVGTSFVALTVDAFDVVVVAMNLALFFAKEEDGRSM